MPKTFFPGCWTFALSVLIAVAGCQPGSVALRPTPAGVSLSETTVADVPLVASVFNAPRVAVKANGVSAEVIIDTGAFASLMSADFARSTAAEVRSTKLRSVNAGGVARSARGIARFDTLAIGSAVFHDVEAVLHDVSVLRTAGEPIVGALGLPVFRDVLLTIDYPNGRLRVERGSLPEPDGRDVLSLRVDGRGLPYVRVRLGSRQAWALLDTGYSLGLALPASMKASVPGAGNTVAGPPVLYYGSGRRQVEQARLGVDVALGRHVIARPIADIDVAGEELILGATYLRHFSITFDQRNGRVRLARRQADPIRTPSIRGTGYYVHPVDASIIAIVPASGADRAGLWIGDKLLAIDGVPMSTYRIVGDLPRAREDEVVVTYERGGKAFTAVVKVGVLVK
jgi:hypothetical protein